MDKKRMSVLSGSVLAAALIASAAGVATAHGGDETQSDQGMMGSGHGMMGDQGMMSMMMGRQQEMMGDQEIQDIPGMVGDQGIQDRMGDRDASDVMSMMMRMMGDQRPDSADEDDPS